MGHSQASKESTHDRIVEIAAERFCELGIDGLSIANLMKEAGLTHGGFYKHFASRDELVAEALASAFKRSEAPPRATQVTFKSLVSEYLSDSHRDAVGTGCAVGALVNDVGRLQGEAKDLYTQKVKANLRGISRLIGQSEKQAVSADAIVAFCAMVGALGLSRAVSNDKLSKEILSVVSQFLLHSFSPAQK